jgi:hypothetical protein
MSRYGECLLSELVRQAGNVSRKLVEIVARDPVRFVAEIVAALIWYNHMESMFRERFDLVPPAIPKLWKSVKKEYQRAIRRPGLRDM